MSITLITHTLCPYVQRSVILLTEKQVPFERVDIDLSQKPDWFLKMSPLGKVPVLVHGQLEPIFESAVICEYLDEVTPGQLHPDDAAEKARHRAWIEFGSEMLNEIGRLYNAPSLALYEASKEKLEERWHSLANALGQHPGRFFAGDQFTLVDAVFGPIFRYFNVLDTLDDFNMPVVIQSWRDQLSQRPSVRGAVAKDYERALLAFIQGRGSHLARLANLANQAKV